MLTLDEMTAEQDRRISQAVARVRRGDAGVEGLTAAPN